MSGTVFGKLQSELNMDDSIFRKPQNDLKEEQLKGLKLLRKPFEPHQISKMCRSTKSSNQKGKCPKCGGYHGLPAVQLSYVGHAALTDRLLEADPSWTWEPLAIGPDGYPVIDKDGGMWIKLTVCGVTRLGYGDNQNREKGDGTKERIGDALRNAAMRFGAALDLWHKGELHLQEEPEDQPQEFISAEQVSELSNLIIDVLEPDRRSGFFKFMGVETISEIKATDYKKAINALTVAKSKKDGAK